MLLSAFEDVIELNNRSRESEAALRELNGELRKANAALEQANQVKDKFLGIAAHDLRNPLGVIQGLSSLLLDGEVGPLETEQTDCVQRIKRQAGSMLHLLHDLLDISALRAAYFSAAAILTRTAASENGTGTFLSIHRTWMTSLQNSRQKVPGESHRPLQPWRAFATGCKLVRFNA